MSYKIKIKRYSATPFLSIVTRCYLRPKGFERNQQSIAELNDKDIEQVFITDLTGQGMLAANKSFELVKDAIIGDYVFLLDDDDFIIDPDMVSDLKEVFEKFSPGIIFFKMHINNTQNCLYPTPNCWGNKPIRGSIGGSCFVVKKEIYQKFIHNFGTYPMGDFAFINAVWESNPSFYWLDKHICSTGKVSRGAKE